MTMTPIDIGMWMVAVGIITYPVMAFFVVVLQMYNLHRRVKEDVSRRRHVYAVLRNTPIHVIKHTDWRFFFVGTTRIAVGVSAVTLPIMLMLVGFAEVFL